MFRDCLRYAFIALLQRELNDIRRIWNTHLIRKSRQHSVTGIPNELFYIPNIQGNLTSVMTHNNYYKCKRAM